MNRKNFRAFLAVGALATASATWGCVADRPSRNGVFNENQYIRKDFLVQPADGSGSDPGWMMKATIVSASTPNPLANLNFFVGAESGGAYVRFGITSDKLQVLSARELGPVDPTQASRVPEVVNAWPVTNVDLKYQINLDGEKTNFYQENQELDWQVRQWVKVNLDKNDMSDFAPFGEYINQYVNTCIDTGNVTATLVPNTFLVDEPNNYMTWQVQFTLPLKFDDQACVQGYGADDLAEFSRLGRTSVTMNLMYSFARATPMGADGTVAGYQPLEIAEKDPILHKYGPIMMNTITRDPESQLLASRQLAIRYDPTKPIQWFFAPGYPEEFKDTFTMPGGIVDQTNQLLQDAGVAARISILNYNDDKVLGDAAGPVRQYGDLRYSFIRWESDLDTGSPFLAVTQFMPDPRTGQAISASINVAGFPIKEYVAERVNAYLKSTGAAPDDILDPTEWPAPASYTPDPNEKLPKGAACVDGDVVPIDDKADGTGINQTQHNGSSTLLTKMQGYLGKPLATSGPLGTKDFIAQQDQDFYHAYFTVVPYVVFADPASNYYVTPEGGQGIYGPAAQQQMLRDEAEFQKHASDIDHGYDPFEGVSGPTGLQNATAFMNRMRQLVLNKKALEYSKLLSHPHAFYDTPDVVSLQGIMQKDARHCINGQWETKKQWFDSLVHSYWALTVWHEFGHALGLQHNFMASVDKPNYPTYMDHADPPRQHVGMYQSSVMEYNNTADRIFWSNDTGGNGWGPYDKGALTWIYANTAPAAIPAGSPAPQGISGQITSTIPWKDPHGFSADGKTETQFLFCYEPHMAYTPLCRTFDTGSTPSEMIANSIDNYEWQYKWRNYRQYFKFWNDGPYANAVAGLPIEMRRFLSLWVFDFNGGSLPDTFRRLGINPPPGIPAAQYYDQLGNSFDKELSAAGSMTAAFHNAVMQQSNGERPVATVYDKYFGDVTQQGIILDKYFSMLDWTALWPTSNYDLNQAGYYIASYQGLGDASFNSISETTINTMVGGGYDTFPWFVPSAVATFAQDTHSPSFGGRVDVRDWIGGHVFYRLEDFLTYFRDLAVQNTLDPFATVSSTVIGGSTAPSTITVDSTTGLNVGDVVTVDGGLSQEQAQILNITPATNQITLVLTKAHPPVGATSYPVLGQACTTVELCHYDPRPLSDVHNEFTGPDKRIWSWAYIADRNVWVAVQKERNTATYIILRNYNDDIIGSQDDGAFPGAAYGLQLPIKYTLDAFNQYN